MWILSCVCFVTSGPVSCSMAYHPQITRDYVSMIEIIDVNFDFDGSSIYFQKQQ